MLVFAFRAAAAPAENPDPQNQQQTASAAGETVYELGPGITAPRVIKQVEPVPSGDFRKNGSVLVRLIVNAQGIPEKVTIVRGLDEITNKSAVEAVSSWRFACARKGGLAVAVRITVELRFHDV